MAIGGGTTLPRGRAVSDARSRAALLAAPRTLESRRRSGAAKTPGLGPALPDRQPPGGELSMSAFTEPCRAGWKLPNVKRAPESGLNVAVGWLAGELWR